MMRPRHMGGFIQWAAHYSLYTSFPPGHDDDDDGDGNYDDDDVANGEVHNQET